MTKWQNFLHSLGIHDWHKVRDFEQEFPRKPCGQYDPRPQTEIISMVERVCCQCGQKEGISEYEWFGF